MDRARRLRNRSIAPLLAALGPGGGLVRLRGRPHRLASRREPAWSLTRAPRPTPLPVGSLQKPFVAKAWARAHPAAVPEPFRCDARSGCWLRSGHGLVDVTRATALSCNAYFRHLADGTPEGVLVATLRGEGFVVGEHALSRGRHRPRGRERDHPARDAPRRLSSADARAVDDGEPVRRLLLSGLRDAALSGTANGLARRGYWAKTGTSAAIDGRPLRPRDGPWRWTTPAGACWASCRGARGARRPFAWPRPSRACVPWTTPIGPRRATAAREGPGPSEALASPISSACRSSRPSLHRECRLRNCGGSPASGARGYVGAGATLDLRAGRPPRGGPLGADDSRAANGPAPSRGALAARERPATHCA